MATLTGDTKRVAEGRLPASAMGAVTRPQARAGAVVTAAAYGRPLAATPCGRLLFTGVAVLAGVHTLVDAVVLPEAGTHGGEHVMAATASLAILAAGVLAYGRLREGGRAVVSLALGALALEGAALAIADAQSGGVRGENWTGFLLGPAGASLVCWGAVVLWRSRKPHGRRWARRALLAVAGVLAVYWVLVPVGVALMATHRPREVVDVVDLGRRADPVTIRTVDGLRLNGRYVPSQNGAAVIVFPGSPSRAPQARVLVHSGYGVLMLDMRGYAESEGDSNMFGWDATKDIDAGVAFLRGRTDVREGSIGGLGFSVGGELMLEAAAGNRALRAVVADGAGERSVRESRLRGRSGWFALPAYAVQTAALTVLGGDLPPPSLVDMTPKIAPRPLLLIGAGRDNGGEDLQPHYYAAARQPKFYWKIPEAGHTGGYAARPREYSQRMLAFFDEALLDRQPTFLSRSEDTS